MSKAPPSPDADVKLEAVLRELESSATQARRSSRLYKAAILVLFACAIWVLFFAADIIKRDTNFLTDERGVPLTDEKGRRIMTESEPRRVTDIVVWQSTITRLGVISLIVYLMRISLRESCYATRRNAYAIARKHAITLGLALKPDEIQRIAILASVFNADAIDAGSEPQSPFEEATKMVGNTSK